MLRRRKQHKEFWTRQSMVPTAAGQAAGEHAARARRWRRLVGANFVAFPFAVLALVLVTAQLILTQNAVQGTGAGDTVPTIVRAEALRSVRQWLSSDSPPLSEAEVAGWDGAEKMEWPESTKEKDRTYQVWVARVLVSSDIGVYVAGVQVTVENGGATAGTPSLEVVPSAAGASGSLASGWPGTSPVPASEPVTRAIQAWAEAYTSGDPAVLTTVVADPDTSHTYLPISGFTAVTATVDAAAYRPFERGQGPDTSQLMVSVNVQAERDGLSRPAVLRFDLLVTDPTTGAARVTAWGAPGSGPALVPYANAVAADMAGQAAPAPSPPASAAPSHPTATPTPVTTGSPESTEED